MKTLNLNALLADLEKNAGIEKTASAAKPTVSAELSGILEKKATEDITSAALAAGEALAKELLTKLAADNKIQIDNNAIVAFDNQKIVPNEGSPGTDTKPEPGLDGALEGTVEEGLKRGAKTDDIVDEKVDNGIKKEAQTKTENSEMAKNIMQKIAQIVGETPTTPAADLNMTPGTTPNLIQLNNTDMTKFDDVKVQALPGAEGSLNNILEAIVDRAKAQGAISEDLVNGDLPASDATGDKTVLTPDSAFNEDQVEKAAAVTALVEAGCDFDSAIAMVKEAEQLLTSEANQQEKIAAVNELCAAGYDFDSAVALVKQAEAELSGENQDMNKVAAVQDLMSQGYDFDTAIDMVKEAVSMEDIKAHAGDIIDKAKGAAGAGYEKAKGAAGAGYEKAKGATSKVIGSIKTNPGKSALFGGALLAGAAAKKLVHRKHEKKAAFDALIEAGVDFEQAAALVKQAEIDVYGEK
jgi:hypothetical protein